MRWAGGMPNFASGHAGRALGSLPSWLAAGAVAWFVVKRMEPSPETRHVSRETVLKEDAAAFQHFQAQRNTAVKEADRTKATLPQEHLTPAAVTLRQAKGELDPNVDFMTDMENEVGPDGLLRKVKHGEAKMLDQWKMGVGDISVDELERLRRVQERKQR
eukprot:Sspe_Gene.107937::Locus_86922_Transcript_1_1_Confidence_1.000_Length_563::g.107937::m.107937